MANWLLPQWGEMFIPSRPLLDTFLRGTLVYLGLFVLLRIIPQRQGGKVGLSDMLLIVLIADASQNAMANEYKSVADGFLLVGTLIFWDYALDWLSYRIPRLGSLLYPRPLLLIRNGKIQKEHLQEEVLTEEQLKSHIRQHGVADVSQVKEAYLEGTGKISVIKKEKASEEQPALRSQACNGKPGEDRPEADEVPPPSANDKELHPFLDAASKLQERMQWHQEQVREHQARIAAIKEVLEQHGFRWKARPRSKSREKAATTETVNPE